MNAAHKSEITQIQIRFLKAIKSHKACYEKLQNGDQSSEITEELQNLKKQMLECHEEQKALLKQISAKDGAAVYKFDLYKIPAEALPKKTRSRKEKIQPLKLEKKISQELWRPRSPSPATPSPTESSSSSSCEESEEDEVMSQASLPVPLPRPSLLNKNTTLSRHDIRYPKLGRRTRLSLKREQDSVVKEIPTYSDPPPSPEPTDEHQAKIKFMKALNLIPVENLVELLSRKTERKRRSTASNQYLYNSDWEVPAVKRKQYLSPAKGKISIQSCPPKSEKKKNSDDVSVKSPQHDNDDSTGAKCKFCGACDTMVSCSECNETFHPKCSIVPELEQRFLSCRRCSRARSDTLPKEFLDEFELSDKEEKEGETEEEKSKASLFEERLKLRNHLLKVLRCRLIEKRVMERKVLQLSESLALQGRVKMDLLQESKEVGAKVDFLRNFVTLFQMQDGKPRIVNAVTSPRVDDNVSSLPLTPEELASPPLTPEESVSLPMTPDEAASLPFTPEVGSPPLTPKSSDDGCLSLNPASQDPLLCE